MTVGFSETDRQSQSFSNDQIIYKLGQIETRIQGISDTFVDIVRRLEDKITEAGNKHLGVSGVLEKEQALLEKRLDANDTRLGKLETWRDQISLKIGFGVSGLALFWVVFGDAVKNSLGHIFG